MEEFCLIIITFLRSMGCESSIETTFVYD